jgi:hypothetical protein
MRFWMALEYGYLPKFNLVGSTWNEVEDVIIAEMGPEWYRKNKNFYEIKEFRLEQLV